MSNLGPIRYLTIHCSGSPAGRNNTAADVCAWDRERFGQPSYHWVIDEQGRATRSLPDTRLGAHVGGHNTGNIGVCYIGGTDAALKPLDTRTAAQRDALRRIVAMYKHDFVAITVRGHRDWPNVKKACPCFDVATEL